MANNTARTKNRATTTTSRTRTTTPDWISTLMSKDPEFTLTIKAEGRMIHEVSLSPNVIRQLATDTQALRTLGPIIREKYNLGSSQQRKVA